MGAGLYDAAFATLGRLYGREARGAITNLTLFGGFASTVCWPLSAFLVGALGWRGTCLAYAGLQLALALPAHLALLPREPAGRGRRAAGKHGRPGRRGPGAVAAPGGPPAARLRPDAGRRDPGRGLGPPPDHAPGPRRRPRGGGGARRAHRPVAGRGAAGREAAGRAPPPGLDDAGLRRPGRARPGAARGRLPGPRGLPRALRRRASASARSRAARCPWRCSARSATPP